MAFTAPKDQLVEEPKQAGFVAPSAQVVAPNPEAIRSVRTDIDTTGTLTEKDLKRTQSAVEIGRRSGIPFEQIDGPNYSAFAEGAGFQGDPADDLGQQLKADDQLGESEKDARDISNRGVMGQGRDVGQAFFASIPQTAGRSAQGIIALNDAASRRLVGVLSKVLPSSVIDFINAPLPDVVDPFQSIKATGEAFEAGGKAIDIPAERRTLATDISSGVGQVIVQATAAFLNPGAALLTMSGEGAEAMERRVEAQGKLGTVGGDIAITAGGVITGAIEKFQAGKLISKTPYLGKLFNKIPDSIKSKWFGKIIDPLSAGAGEAVQETVEGALQDAVALATINPDVEFFQEWRREALAAGGAAGIFRVMVNTVFFARARGAFNPRTPVNRVLSDGKYSEESFNAIATAMPKKDFVDAYDGAELRRIASDAYDGNAIAQKHLRDFEAQMNRESMLSDLKKTELDAAESIELKETKGRKAVALTKAEIAEVREDFGMDQLPTIKRESFEQILETAKELKVDEQAEAIASEIIDNPRTITENEHAGLVLRATQLEKDFESKLSSASQAAVDGKPELASKLGTEAQVIQERLDLLERASNVSGSEASRALNIRKMRIRKDDFSLSKMINLAQVNKGEPLTPVEQDFFKRLSDKIKNQRDKITDLESEIDQITEGKIPARLRKKLVKALVENKQTQREANRKIDQFRKKSTIEKFGDVAALPRSLLATADMSAVLRQGALLSARRPIQSAKILKDSTKALFSQFKTDEIDLALRSRPTFELGQAAGLYLTPLDRIDLAAREETFASSLAERIPGWGKVVLASERHMVTHLNMLRAAAFDQFVVDLKNREIPKNQMAKDLKAWAKYVNNASGRGSLGGFESSAKALSTLFFAPRFAVSRIQAPLRLLTNWKNPTVRNEIAKDFAAFAGVGMVALTLASLAGFEIGDEPEDSDFGKIIIGKTRVDVWGGFQQPMRLMYNWGASGVSRTGLIESPDMDLRDATMRFAMYKASPLVSIGAEFLTGEDAIGRDTEALETVVNSILPLVMQESWEAYNSDDPENLLFVMPAAFFGISTSTFKKRKKKSSSSTRRRNLLRKE